MIFDKATQWIWLTDEQDDGERNITGLFRTTLSLDVVPQSAELTLSADCRFVLWVNGTRVGQGPMRSWPHKKGVDRYELSPYMQAGENVLAISVVHWRIACSFDIAEAPAGLIAELRDGTGRVLSATGAGWKTERDAAFQRRVPRMAYGMAYTEQYDARLAKMGWREAGFDDTAWSAARELGPEGLEPWGELGERSIPLLLEQRLYPRVLQDARSVEPPRCQLSYDFLDSFRELDTDPSAAYEMAGVLLVELHAEQAGDVLLLRNHTSFNLDAFNGMRLNGADLVFEPQDRTTLELRKGSNLLALRFQPHYQTYPEWVLRGETGLRFTAPGGDADTYGALYVTRSLEGDETADLLWALDSASGAAAHEQSLRPMRDLDMLENVFVTSNAREERGPASDCIDAPAALCSDNAALTTISPPQQGDLEFLLDFGEELVGFLELEIDAPEGAVIDFNCFEAVRDEAWVWTDNLHNTLRYTCREGWQRFHSTVRRGFRYAQVTLRNFNRPVRIRSMRCLQNTYPVQHRGAFDCSDGTLTRAWEIARRTTQLCMEDTFVDCPAYEQTFWVGDCRNESLANYRVFGDTTLAKRCLVLAADSLFRSPIPEQCVPYRDAHKHILPAWAFFWTLACEELYQYEGDLEFARSILPAVEKTLGSFLARRGEDGLMRFPGWNMLDWAPMDVTAGGAILHENAWLVRALRAGATLAEALEAPQAPGWRADADALAEAVNREIWDEDKAAYADCKRPDGSISSTFSQQSQTVAYLCGVVPEKRLDKVLPLLTDPPEDFVQVRTPFMAWFCFEAFAELDDQQAILDWIRRIWGEMLRCGATTCWEHFIATDDTAFRWAPTRSWCHAWSAAPAYFLPTYQLGVQSQGTAWSKVLVAPDPVDLSWAKGRVPTPRGEISVDWKIENGRFSMTIVAPEGVDLEYRVPRDLEEGVIHVLRREAVYASGDSVG